LSRSVCEEVYQNNLSYHVRNERKHLVKRKED